MEKTELKTFGRVLMPGTETRKKALSGKNIRAAVTEALFCIIGFFCGQAVCFGGYYPIGLAVAGAFLREGYTFYLILISAAAGFLRTASSGSWAKYGIAGFGLLAAQVFLKKQQEPTAEKKAAATALAMGGSGLLFAAVNGFSGYLAMVAVLEAAAVGILTLLAVKGTHVLVHTDQRKRLTAEESLCLAAILAMAVMGSGGIMIKNISLTTALSAFLVLYMSFAGGIGAGAATGVLLGFLLLVAGQVGVAYFCLLSLLGLCCGSLRDLGRVAVLLGFLAATAIGGFFLDRTLLTRDFFIALGIAGAGFLLVPNRVFGLFAGQAGAQEKEALQFRTFAKERLADYGTAFSALASAVDTESPAAFGKREISAIIDQVGAKVCENCGLATYCWQDVAPATFDSVRGAIEVCRRRGRAEVSDMSKGFLDTCVRYPAFVDALNEAYKQCEGDRLWLGRLAESRALLAEQMREVSGLLHRFGDELALGYRPLPGERKRLLEALDQKGLPVEAAEVWENADGVLEAAILCKNPVRTGETAEEVLQEVLGKRFLPKQEVYLEGEGLFKLRFRQEPKYRISVALAAETKTGSEDSGDSHCVMELTAGGTVLALSDGMGSGPGAKLESKAAIEFLERFLSAGFPLDAAVRLMNSALFFQSREETFATLDLCYVDTDTGAAQFVKTGAGVAFVLRDKKVKSIRGSSLPMGILPLKDISQENIELEDGDIIVMMTDGAADALEQKKDGTEALTQLLRRYPGRSPRDLAEYLLCTAKEVAEGNIRDDMTVLVGRIWKKAS